MKKRQIRTHYKEKGSSTEGEGAHGTEPLTAVLRKDVDRKKTAIKSIKKKKAYEIRKNKTTEWWMEWQQV